jgi:membrane carboxypeptidase/penicillin-binding protein
VRLAERVGLSYLTGYLPRFGLPGPIPRNLSIALGTLEVTPMEPRSPTAPSPTTASARRRS